MLCVVTKTPKSRTLTCLSPVLKGMPDLPVEVISDGEIPAGATALLVMGSEALKRLQDAKTVAKNRSLTSLRTQPLTHAGIPALVSYSPDIGEIDPGKYINVLTDVALALRFIRTGSWKPQLGDYTYVESFQPVIDEIKAEYEQTGKPVDCTFDLETVGTDPYALPDPKIGYPGAYIVTFQFTNKAGKAYVVRTKGRSHEEALLKSNWFRDELKFILQSPMVKLKGANLKYDLGWMWARAAIDCTSFVFDTTIVGSLLDENRSNALNIHTKIYVPRLAGYDDEFNNTLGKVSKAGNDGKARMDLIPPDALLPYAGGDVDACYEVANAQKKELLQDPRLTSFYVNILHPASRAFEHIEQHGVLIDMDAYKELKSDLEKEHIRLVIEAQKILGGRIVAKHRDPTKPGGMNLGKASMLCDFLFSPMGLNLKPQMWTEKPDKDGNKKPATSKEHLVMFKDVPEAAEFIKFYLEDASVMKTYTTYVVGFMEHIRSDGRFHPTYFLYAGDKEEDEGGTNTGRLSAKDPAFQTIPKHTKWAKRIRRIFIAPDGYVIVERDYSQGELRIAACVANELNMIQAYREGKDLHAMTAGPFRGYDYDGMMKLEKENEELFSAIRQLGKAGNFGLLYGMGAVPGFQNYAATNYGVHLSDEEAQAFRKSFFDRYPGLLVYHDVYKGIAKVDKQVRSPLGRVRHLPLIDSKNKEFAAKAERQAINSPIQGCLSDMCIWALAREKQMGISGRDSDAPAFGAVHDAILNYVREDKVDTIVPQMIENMENLPFEKVGWKPQLKFIADAKVGKNMADMAKYKVKKPVAA